MTATTEELNSYDRDHIACKNENIYYLALQKNKQKKLSPANSWSRGLDKFNEFSEFQIYSFMPPIYSTR